jgi:predicted small secreted protein
MAKRMGWVANRISRASPALATFALIALSIVLAACGSGNGGGSGY